MVGSPWNFGLNDTTPKNITLPRFDAKSMEVERHVELSPPLGKGERGGLLAVPTKTGTGRALVEIGSSPTHDGAMKVALLFVEKIDVPNSPGFLVGTESVDQLTSMGIVGRSQVNFPGPIDMDVMLSFPWLAYLELEKREPGRWSIWQDVDQQLIPSDQLSPGLAFQLELRNALIVPNELTPFEDVIAFKERNRDELISLRHHLEDFAIKLSREGDPRALNLELERFDVSLSDYLRKARESNVAKAFASITAEYDWAAAIRSIAGGGSGGLVAAAQGFSLPAAAAAVVGGGVLAGLSLKSVSGTKEGPSPFRYIARIEREYGC